MQAHPEKVALCEFVHVARDVAAQPQVRQAYLEDGSRFEQRGQSSVSHPKALAWLQSLHPSDHMI